MDEQPKHSRRYLKKLAAQEHNRVMEMAHDIADDVFPVGACKCEGTLFLYLKSEDENLFKIRCTDCDEEHDVRDPKDGVTFYVSPMKQMSILKIEYGEERVGRLVDT